MSSNGTLAGEHLLAFIERVERIEEEIKACNDDKRDIYAEAKSVGFDVKAIKTIVRRRARDQGEVKESDVILETYLHAIDEAMMRRAGRGTVRATRAPAQGNANSTQHPTPGDGRTSDLPRRESATTSAEDEKVEEPA